MLEIKFISEGNRKPITYFRKINEHVVCLDLSTENTSGFHTYVDGRNEGDFSNFKTIYKQIDNLTYFSNDGSIWIEPTKEAIINVEFSGELDDRHIIPNEVEVLTNKGKVLVTKANNWEYTFSILESENIEILDAEELNGFEKTIDGETIKYHSDAPTWQEKIDAQVLYTALMTDTLVEEGEL